MNLTKAVMQAMENTRTWGEILDVLNGADKSGLCTHNRQMTRARAADVAETQILKNDPSDVPEGTRYNHDMGKEVMTGEGMLIMNILKEFG